MAEQSYIFDFSRVPSFFDNMNIKFALSDMDGTDKFQLVLIKHGANNIDEYLASDGTLDSSISSDELLVANCGLDWVKDETGDGTIELHNKVEFSIGDINIPLKAVVLRNKENGYVMGYSINNVPFTVTHKVVFDEDVVFWDITRINNYG